MSDTILLRVRVPKDRYETVEAILAKLGITPSAAVNMLYAQIEQQQGIPFRVSLNLPPDESDGASREDSYPG